MFRRVKPLIRQNLVQFDALRPLLEWRETRTDPELQEDLDAILRATDAQWKQLADGVPQPTGDKTMWIASALPILSAVRYEMLLALIARHVGYEAVILQTETQFSRFKRHAHRSIGNSVFLDMLDYEAALGPLETDPSFSFVLDESVSVEALMDFSYRQVPVGRIALTVVADRHKVGKLDLTQHEIRQELYDAICNSHRWILTAENMLAAQPPSLIYLQEKAFSPTAELYYVAVSRGIPVVQIAVSTSGDDLVFKRFHAQQKFSSPRSFSPSTWDQICNDMPWDETRSQQIVDMLEQQYRAGAWGAIASVKYDRPVLTREALIDELDLDPHKLTAVIFSHVLWDTTYTYGRVTHFDFESWLLEAVQLAVENPNLNWVVKLHPHLAWIFKDSPDDTELYDVQALRRVTAELPNHVRLVMPDSKINTFSFFSLTDYCLTVQGTIGLEMACFGIPVITAGTGRYAGLGFTTDVTTQGAYRDLLTSLHQKPLTMTDAQVQLARRYLYAATYLRPWRSAAFESVVDKEARSLMAGWELVPQVKSYSELLADPDIRRLATWLQSDEADLMAEFTSIEV